MCETTPFVNTVGAHYVASRAQIEQACDSLRQHGSSRVTKIGLSKVDVCADMTESPCTIVEALVVPEPATWSTMVMHTHPFTDDILQNVHPCHEVLLSCKPHHPGCHQWRPMQQQIHDDLKVRHILFLLQRGGAGLKIYSSVFLPCSKGTHLTPL